MKTVFGEDWSKKIKIIFAGDDVTDEDAMSALKGIAHSFRYENNYDAMYKIFSVINPLPLKEHLHIVTNLKALFYCVPSRLKHVIVTITIELSVCDKKGMCLDF